MAFDFENSCQTIANIHHAGILAWSLNNLIGLRLAGFLAIFSKICTSNALTTLPRRYPAHTDLGFCPGALE